MQGNPTTNTVQLGVTIDHISILLRMVEHTRHAMTAEHVRGVTVTLRHCNNLDNRVFHFKIQFHQPIHPLHNLLIHHCHPHQFYHPNNSIHSLALLSLRRIMTAYSVSVQNRIAYNWRVIMDVNGNSLTLMLSRQKLETISVKIVEEWHPYSIRTTTCIQGQVALTSPHSPRWRKCSFHLYMR